MTNPTEIERIERQHNGHELDFLLAGILKAGPVQAEDCPECGATEPPLQQGCPEDPLDEGVAPFEETEVVHYDYDNQCWKNQDNQVLPCGHQSKFDGCFACHHAGEKVG